jgi:hypothetical protein
MAKGTNTEVERDDWPVEDEDIATHQEAIPVPYMAGTRRIGARWITGALNMVTKQTEDPNWGKK